jgi:hypothetical protein
LTNPIFNNIKRENAIADADPTTIRISMDTKASIKVGDFSRGGYSRGLEAIKALDHDFISTTNLTLGGILNTKTGEPFLFFTKSNKTSEFMIEGLKLWWAKNKPSLSGINQIVINLDNGPECSGHRSLFLSLLVAFAHAENIIIRLIYYPPYHSKYNLIERFWGGLERFWYGYLLSSVDCVLRRAASFVWKNMQTTVALINGVFDKGISISKEEKVELEKRLIRSKSLPWYDITISPLMVC